MKRVRIIPVLLLKDNKLVKTIRFKNPKYIGDPINAVRIFNDKEVDEIVILDISTNRGRETPNIKKIIELAGEAFMPVAYGGSIKTLEQISEIILNGAEKVILNSVAFSQPDLITKAANIYGSQSIVVSIDVKKDFFGRNKVFIHNGSVNTTVDPVSYAKKVQALGAGEILLNSIRRDGTYKGYDLDLLKQVCQSVQIPVIAGCGASKVEDFVDAVNIGKASALAAGSLFVYHSNTKGVLINYPSAAILKEKVYSKLKNMRDSNIREYLVCTKCVMDTTAPGITFDGDGVCSFCHHYTTYSSQFTSLDKETREKRLNEIIQKIKTDSANKKYDVILGLSGGVDSSYLGYLINQWGLRPLVVHFDNGWNSELAVINIENLVSKYNFDLKTFVMDWEEFKDLQLSYLKASVVDIEVPTDQLIFASLYKLASRYKIKYIVSGSNYQSESIMPAEWANYAKLDLVNLKNIHKKFGTRKLKKLPKLGYYQRYYYEQIEKIALFSPLNLLDYNKAGAKEIISKEFGWRDYGGKHYESLWTKFYQGYILPNKFNIDKRKAHLSNLICSGQITREEALKELSDPPITEAESDQILEYVHKKFELTRQEFDDIMKLPRVEHSFYGTEEDNKTQHKIFFSVIHPGLAFKRLIKRLLSRIRFSS